MNNSSIVRLVATATTVVLLCACSESTATNQPQLLGMTNSESVRAPKDQSGCVVNGVTAALSRAVCSSDPTSIRDVLFDLHGPERDAAVSALRALWTESEAAGTSIPWEHLREPSVKLAYAPTLVQAVRIGSISLPLDQFQDLAYKVATGESGTLEEIEAIRLLGLSDGAPHIKLLVQKIGSTTPAQGAHSTAIEALGFICSREAAAALDELEKSKRLDPGESRAIERARSHRQEIEGAWCK